MTDKESNRYPNNQAYISKNNNSDRFTNLPNHRTQQSMRASVLAERVHDLEEQLISIASALNEDGRENRIWQQQLVKQHNEVNQLLQKRQREIQNLRSQLKKSEDQKQQLKNSLFRQNEQFQNMQKQLQDARTTNSRVNGKQLEEKVLQLNDQISTLLVKIQQLIEENNQHITYIEDLQRAVNEFKANQEIYEANLQSLTDENNYLKEQIKEVENMNIYQQTEIQNKYIEQLEEAKVQLQTLKSSHVQSTKKQSSPRKATNTDRNELLEKENNKLRGQIHNLEEQLLQQREVQRSVKKKYEEKLNIAEAQVQRLNDQITKLKHANRKLQNVCAENSFALEQLQKQKKDIRKLQSLQSQDQYKNIILRLQTQKEQLNLRLAKLQIQMKYEQHTQLYQSLLREGELKIERLKEELKISEVEIVKSKNSVKEYSELAKRWQEDYRLLAKSYEEGLALRRQNQERTRMEQLQLEKEKQRYWQTVRKCKMTQQLYKEVQEKLKIYEQSQAKPNTVYDKESSDLIKLQNSTLKQEVYQLRYQITQLNRQLSNKNSQNSHRDMPVNTRQLDFYKQRQLQLQRQMQLMKNRLTAQHNNSKESDMIKIRELNDQLTRVNKMLNQREIELDSFKEKYTELQSYLNRRQETVAVNRQNPQYTRLKNQFVALQRKLMETQLYYKNNIQNANYEIESLKVENMYHRKKIEQLLQQLSHERNSLDYGKISRSLQFSQLKIKQLQKQLQFSQLRINELNQQLRRSRSRSRKNSQQLQLQNNQNKNIKNMNYNDYLQYESNTQNQQSKRSQPSNQMNTDIQRYNSSSYDQIMKWKEEIKQSRTNFSKKWANQFNADHIDNPHLWYPIKQQIRS